MVAFIIIIIVIILLFIQPHVIYHKQSTQMGFLAALPGGIYYIYSGSVKLQKRSGVGSELTGSKSVFYYEIMLPSAYI